MKSKKDKRKKLIELILFRIVPLLISIIAITLSLISFGAKHKESIKISVKRMYGGYKTDIIKVENDLKFPAMLKTRFNILLINNSERTVSFGSQKVDEVKENGLEDYGKNVCELNFSNGQKAEFPFSVASGNSRKLQIIIGLKIAKQSYDILMEKFKSPMQNSIREIEKILLENKTDIYGNHLTITSKNDFAISYNLDYENLIKQDFIFSLKTIRSNTFTAFFSYY